MIPYQSQVVFKHLRNQTNLHLLFLKIEKKEFITHNEEIKEREKDTYHNLYLYAVVSNKRPDV